MNETVQASKRQKEDSSPGALDRESDTRSHACSNRLNNPNFISSAFDLLTLRRFMHLHVSLFLSWEAFGMVGACIASTVDGIELRVSQC